MTKKIKRIGIYFPILILSVIATVALRTIALFKNFEPASGYFGDKTMLNISVWILFGACVIFLSYSLTKERGAVLRFDFSSPRGYIPAALLSLAALFLSTSLFIKAFDSGISIFSPEVLSSPIVLIELISAAFALGTVVYLVLNMLIAERYSVKRGGMGLLAVLFFAVYAAYLYFDTTLPINAPNKLTDQMSYLFASLLFLFEVRISLGREAYKAYTVFALICTALSAYASIPTLIYYIFGDGIMVSNSFYDCFLSLAVFIFSFARLIAINKTPEDRESEFITALLLGSDEREAYIHKLSEEERLRYVKLFNRIAKREEEEARAMAERLAAGEGQTGDNADTDEPQEQATAGIAVFPYDIVTGRLPRDGIIGGTGGDRQEN